MIQINHLNKSYNMGQENGCEVLRDVSLHIASGELVAVMGASGAGKSTLLHILACIDTFDNGEYVLDGLPITRMSDRKMAAVRNEKIGIVMQDFALIEDFSALQNVMIPLDFSKKHRKKKEKKELAVQALEKVQMGEYVTKQIRKLSGGQKQRVAIARAIVNQPPLLLADEPTGALDSATSQEIMRLFQEIHATGQTVVIVTHDENIARQCQRMIRISDGVILEGDAPDPQAEKSEG